MTLIPIQPWEELASRSDLLLAYIAEVHPSAEFRERCEELLLRRRVVGRARRWLALRAECAGAVLAVTRGGDEDLDPGCMAVSERQMRWAAALGTLLFCAVIFGLVGMLFWLEGSIARAALLSGLLLFGLLRRRRRRRG